MNLGLGAENSTISKGDTPTLLQQLLKVRTDFAPWEFLDMTINKIHLSRNASEIGRASCRERVSSPV